MIAIHPGDIRDLGLVDANTVHQVEFAVSNLGSRTLVLKEIKSSCGCAKAVASEYEVDPGGEAKITATIEVGPGGRKSAAMKVYTNDPMREVVTLDIRFRIRHAIRFVPRCVGKGHMSGQHAAW